MVFSHTCNTAAPFGYRRAVSSPCVKTSRQLRQVHSKIQDDTEWDPKSHASHWSVANTLLDSLVDDSSYSMICFTTHHEQHFQLGNFMNTKSRLHLEHTMDRSTSDGAQSTDSGIVLSETLDQSTVTQSQNDLSRLFRLEKRSIVCTSANMIRYTTPLTIVSDWWIGRTRHGSSADPFTIRGGRGGH